MVVLTNIAVAAAPPAEAAAALPPEYRTAALYASTSALEHHYEGDPHRLFGVEELQLERVLVAYQVHPWTVEQLAELGPVDGWNMARWTLEGPTYTLPDEPENCTFRLEIAHSTGENPGTDWREFQAGTYLLRSYQIKLTITRPDDSFDFRVHRLGIQAARLIVPQQGVIAKRFFSHG